MSSHETLGLLLVRDRIITRPQLYDALRLQRQNNRLLGTCLLSLGYIGPELLLQILSRQLAIPALPPGLLSRCSPAAIERVPGELAIRLRVVPYSWDGEILGVAMADGRALNHLHEVAFYSQSAVGAYVALEIEIEAVLRSIYPDVRELPPAGYPTPPLAGRPRPARAEPLQELSGAEIGLGPGGPGAMQAAGSAAGAPDAGGRPVIYGAPPPAARDRRAGVNVMPAEPRAAQTRPSPAAGPAGHHADAAAATEEPAGPVALERLGFYDAVERIYDGAGGEQVGRYVGRALLNYFERALILTVGSEAVRLLGFGGTPMPSRAAVLLRELPTVLAELSHRSIAYGAATTDPRVAELATAFGLLLPATALIAPVTDGRSVRLLAYADNAAGTELYDDLHDVELLLKEAETALGMLAGT